MLHAYFLGVLLCVSGSLALYDSSAAVVELTPSNFDKLVTDSDEIWIVEFFAPWCGHCKNLVPEYKKAAQALKGIVKVGALNGDTHKTFAHKYGVTGFPTIKIFTGSKHTPYQGQRTAEGFVEAGLKAAKEKAFAALGKGTGGGAGDKPHHHHHHLKKKQDVYGHHIPWKKIKRTAADEVSPSEQVNAQSTLTPPYVKETAFTNNQLKLDRMRSRLFRRFNYYREPPRIIRRNLNHKFLKKYNRNFFRP